MYRLITGCGRSGTKYITRVLQKAGLDVEHEGYGKDGSVSFILAFEPDWYPCYHDEDNVIKEFDVVLHQVRHPLKVIKSFMTVASDATWDYVYHHIPITSDMNLIDRTVRYWYYWNLQAESISEMTYRIENLQYRWSEFCKRMGIKMRYPRNIPTNTNHKTGTKIHRPKKFKRAKQLMWKDIKKNSGFYYKVVELGRRYGYKIRS